MRHLCPPDILHICCSGQEDSHEANLIEFGLRVIQGPVSMASKFPCLWEWTCQPLYAPRRSHQLASFFELRLLSLWPCQY